MLSASTHQVLARSCLSPASKRQRCTRNNKPATVARKINTIPTCSSLQYSHSPYSDPYSQFLHIIRYVFGGSCLEGDE